MTQLYSYKNYCGGRTTSFGKMEYCNEILVYRTFSDNERLD